MLPRARNAFILVVGVILIAYLVLVVASQFGTSSYEVNGDVLAFKPVQASQAMLPNGSPGWDVVISGKNAGTGDVGIIGIDINGTEYAPTIDFPVSFVINGKSGTFENSSFRIIVAVGQSFTISFALSSSPSQVQVPGETFHSGELVIIKVIDDTGVVRNMSVSLP